MAFFEAIQPRNDPDPEPRRLPPWMGPPRDWLGGPAVGPVILVRAGNLVVALRSVVAYPVGCLLQIDVHARRIAGQPVEEWWSLHDRVTGHLGYHRHGSEIQQRLLRIGVELSDGRTATNLEQPPLFDGHGMAMVAAEGDAADPAGPILLERGGGAGGGEWEASANREAWLWPLPPPEPFDVVIEWPATDIELTRTPVDGALVAAAAALAQPLWPDAADPQ